MSWLFVLLLIPAAVVVSRLLTGPPAIGVPVDQVIEKYGQPYYDSRAERGDSDSYTLFFSASNVVPRALYVRVQDGRVAESWFWSK